MKDENTHQRDRHEKDHIDHRRTRPIQPHKEKGWQHDSQHTRQSISISHPFRRRDVPEGGADETSGEGAADTGDEAEGGVAAEAGEGELAHETIEEIVNQGGARNVGGGEITYIAQLNRSPMR